MKASELARRLLQAIDAFGDLDVVVNDGMDPSDLCRVENIVFNDNHPNKAFEVRGHELYDFGDPKPVLTDREQRIVEQVAKVLAANSPFLTILQPKPFPYDTERTLVWCVTVEEARALFKPGQPRSRWSRKRRMKFLRHFRRHKAPHRIKTYFQHYEFVVTEAAPTTIFYRHENP